MASIRIIVSFRNAGVPATGLSPTIDIFEVDATPTQVVTADSMTEVGLGLYFYDFTSFNETLDYAFRADGTNTLGNADRYVFGSNEVPIGNRDSVRLDSQGLAASTIESGSFAAGAVNAAALATDAVNEIRDGILVDSTAFNGADIASILADTANIDSLVTTNLNATITSRESESSANSRETTNTAEHAATLAAVNGLNDLAIADVQTALTNQGYTSGRAPNLDNLDAAITSRSTHSAADVDTTLTASHGAGGWTTATGFSTHSAADVDTTLTASHGAGSWQTASGFASETARAKMGVAYNPGGPEVRMSVSLQRENATVTAGLTAATVTWYNPDGTTLFTASTGATADSQGQFDLTSATTLVTNTAYYATVAVTDGTGTVTTLVKVPTVG